MGGGAEGQRELGKEWRTGRGVGRDGGQRGRTGGSGGGLYIAGQQGTLNPSLV